MSKFDEVNMFYGAGSDIFEKASELRKNMTEAEKVMWGELKNRKIYKTRFRRQHPIDIFIADFYCHAHKLIIEIDGEIHSEMEILEYDKGRSYEIEKFGIKILRFTNYEVMNDILNVRQRILDNFPRTS